MLSGKVMVIHLTVGWIENILLYKNEFFSRAITHSKNKIKVELDLSKYTTKSDLKSTTGITLEFARKFDLASLKLNVDESDVDKITNCFCRFN